jgi:hypothetical protein
MMSEAAQKKVDFILTWFRTEGGKFTFRKKIQLAKIWIEICTKNEEYEMAFALSKEKEKLMLEFLKNKRASRTLKQILWFKWIKFKRKFLTNKKGAQN